MLGLTRAILENPSLTPLPMQIEGGVLPALISGLSSVHRANLAAALHLETGRPVFIVVPDESAMDIMERDLGSFLKRPVVTLTARDFTFYSADSVSRQTEQKRLASLDALARGEAPVSFVQLRVF